jgi:hypothetical protein
VGKAYKPPAANYKRERIITAHAVQRLRERIADSDLNSRDDRSVGNALDQAIVWAKAAGSDESIMDRGVLATLVDITEYVPLGKGGDDGLFAIIKLDSHSSARLHTVVTVLTTEQVAQQRETRWRQGPDPSSPFSKLASFPLKPKQAPAATAPTVRRKSDVVLISYRRHEGGERYDRNFDEYSAADAPDRIAALLNDPDVADGTIRLWVEKPFAFKREVKVELDL